MLNYSFKDKTLHWLKDSETSLNQALDPSPGMM